MERFEAEHITGKRLDDGLALQWFDDFFHRLDPRRMYFLQADLQEFQPFADQLAALARQGDVEFANLVRSRFRTRVAEAAGYATHFLGAEHDFTLDEELPLDFETYSADAAELRDRWRLRIKAEILIEKTHGTPLGETKSWLDSRYERITRQACDMSDERLCEIFLDALCAVYDPHSGYMSPTVIESFETLVKLRSYRLGLGFRPDLGRFAVRYVHPSLRSIQTNVLGWDLIAIRRIDGSIHDVVELYPWDLGQLISSVLGPLNDDSEVILELMHPITPSFRKSRSEFRGLAESCQLATVAL